MILQLSRRPVPRPMRRHRGNKNPNRAVVCPKCRRRRHTTSAWPFCKRCKARMEDA